jgi:hypothetical protein
VLGGLDAGMRLAARGPMHAAGWLFVLSALVLAPACSGRYTTREAPAQNEQGLVRCDSYTQCEPDSPCDDGGTCVSIAGCGTALCVAPSSICEQACGTMSCEVLESYPAQMPRCPDGTPIKGRRSDSPEAPSRGGTGGSTPSGPSSGPAFGGVGGSLNPSGIYGMATPDGRGLGDNHVDCASYLQCDHRIGCGETPCIAIDGCAYGVCALPQSLCNEECTGTCTFVAGLPYRIACSTMLTGSENYGGGSSAGGARPWMPATGGSGGAAF